MGFKLGRARLRTVARRGTAALVLTLGATLPVLGTSSAQAAPGAPEPPTGRVALTWAATYMSDDHSYTRTEALSLASRFDLVAAMPVAFKNHSAAMKAANPDLTLIAYAAATLLGKDKTTGVPEAAFAHDSAGKRITYTAFNRWLMEAKNPTWMKLANDQCVQRSTSAGYDGCLIDMMGTGVVTARNTVTSRPADPVTKVTYTEAQYQQNLINLMSYYRTQSPGMIHVPNAVGNAYRYWKAGVKSSTFTDKSSAAQMEDFLRGASEPVTAFPSAADWKLYVDVIRDFESKNKVGLFTTKLWSSATSAQVAQWQKYSMATYLMGANGKSYFAFTRSRDKAGASQTNLPYTMPRDIGMPESAMTQSANGVWTRMFANGMSVVNPTTQTATVKLPATLQTLEGTSVSSLTLPPNSGQVLRGDPSPSASAPTGTIGSISTSAGSTTITGTASDGKGVKAAYVAVRNRDTGLWLRPDGTWGNKAQLPTTLANPGALNTTWTVTLRLAPGNYGVALTVRSVSGATNTNKPWKTFTVPLA